RQNTRCHREKSALQNLRENLTEQAGMTGACQRFGVRSGATTLDKDHDHPALLRNVKWVSLDGWRIWRLPTAGERERPIAQLR
ncbi:MAG: hypothetical protein WA491_09550, partial [Candidatus Acidiferrum sp.]